MYGENVTRLRDGLAELLRQHRVQQYLADPGPPDAPGTPGKRAEAAALMQTYRRGVLAWCHQTAVAVDPFSESNIRRHSTNPFAANGREPRPIDALTRALTDVLARSPVPLPSLAQLTTRQQSPLVESWRHLARWAALAEHDIPAAGISWQQAAAVVSDVAAISQGLIVLDRRYRTLPGWRPLRQGDRLGWAALACAYDAALGEPDYSVDDGGWRPPVKLLRGTVRGGLLGVLQAEHNLSVRLRSEPTVLNLRLVVDSQRLLSIRLADRAVLVDTSLADLWRERADSYGALQRELRDIGSLTGRGGLAAAEGANALSRLRAVPATTRPDRRTLAAFATLFVRVDDRIATLISSQLDGGRLLERVRLELVEEDSNRMVRTAAERFVPVSSETRKRLKTCAHRLAEGAGGAEDLRRAHALSRVELHARLVHRPPSRHEEPELRL